MLISSIRVAIIGGGLIGPRHAKSVINNPSCKLSALVEPAPRGAEVAASLQTAYYASISELIASSDKPDAAIVCTPNHTHVAISKELASAGIHVLVEKPISVDIASGLELIEHAKTCGVKLLVGHHRRFNPYIQATKKALVENAVGKVLAVSGLWMNYKPASYFEPPNDWRTLASGGVIYINLVHEIDNLHYLFGPIVRVHAEGVQKQRGKAADEGAAVILKFRSGIVGTFLTSDHSPSPYNFECGTGENPMIPHQQNPPADFYRIFGTDGSLSVGDMRKWSYDNEGEKGWTKALLQETIDPEEVIPFDAQIEHFVRVIRDKEAPNCSGEEGLRALVVCDAITRAIAGENEGVVDIPVDLSAKN